MRITAISDDDDLIVVADGRQKRGERARQVPPTGARRDYDAPPSLGGGIIEPVRIGFDARAAFLDPYRGFGRVTRCIAEALLRSLPGEVVLFVPHGAPVPQPWYPVAARIVPLCRPQRGAFLLDGPAWRWTLARTPVDVLHLPCWTVPHRLPVPVVATFYDATPFRFASPPQRWRRHRARQAIRSLRYATAVHAISRHARSELLATVDLPEERIFAVYLGVDAGFLPAPTPTPPEHLLFVGGTDPHKNLELILAVIAAPEAVRLPPLVVAGPVTADRRFVAPRLKGKLCIAASPDDATLVSLYQRALALLVPSRNEGFGLPALEAMACGCPVLAARAGALPEICGDAAVLLDPDKPATWREALLALVDDPERRAGLVHAGLARARLFTWERSARELAAVYRAVIRAESARS
jgi:glycosyltransferase involved in cell wall biosynthesis